MAVLQGILSVLCTPFQENGSLDKKSLIRLVEHNLSWEVDGLVCFGLASEIDKLSDRERDEMLELVVEIAAGSVPVIAGTEHSGVETAAIRSQDAARAGAAAVMLYPPTFVKLAPSQVKEYYEEISQKAGVPIIIQDAPAWTDVPLPVDLLVEIKKIAPRVEYVKVEAPPTAPKMAALLEQGLTPLGGYGALHLFEELSAGITGRPCRDAPFPACTAICGNSTTPPDGQSAGSSLRARFRSSLSNWALLTSTLPFRKLFSQESAYFPRAACDVPVSK